MNMSNDDSDVDEGITFEARERGCWAGFARHFEMFIKWLLHHATGSYGSYDLVDMIKLITSRRKGPEPGLVYPLVSWRKDQAINCWLTFCLADSAYVF